MSTVVVFDKNLHRNVHPMLWNMFAFDSFLHNHMKPNKLTIHSIVSILTGNIVTVYMSLFQSIFPYSSGGPDRRVTWFAVLVHTRRCRVTNYPNWTNEKPVLASKILKPRTSNDSMVPT